MDETRVRYEARLRRICAIWQLRMGWRERQVFKADLQAVEQAALERNGLEMFLAERDLERKLDLSRGLS